MTASQAMTTIGVSIEIPQPFGDELREARRAAGDPLADAIPPHITLVAPVDVPDADRAALAEHLTACAAAWEPFVIRLRGASTFRPISEVVFVPLAQGIASCEQLQARVATGPLAVESRFNYHPHVTIAHNVPTPALDRAFDQYAGFDATFEVDHITLYEHGDDEVWRPVQRFAFGCPHRSRGEEPRG